METLPHYVRLKKTGNDLLLVNLTNSSDLPINSVSNSTAQYAKLLQPGSEFETIFSCVKSIIDGEGSHPLFIRAAVELQFLNGLRISEVLSIKGVDVSPTAHIKVTTSKTVSHRLCVTSKYSQFWLGYRGLNIYIFQDYSRFWFYRYYKNAGLSMRFGSSPNSAVTHLFRHLLISENVENSTDMQVLRKFVGHKSIKSTQHYANKK